MEYLVLFLLGVGLGVVSRMIMILSYYYRDQIPAPYRV
jgi:hypothetical protein